eukprot:CAMPEP_0115828370 /NCGR_PEP_ID=MMETSP0287-20121206/537_1 /TAXON_ID=412157 /ORGANISM="Chrysochromulina rotalis, Strain UIO044" /LENGTH=315 /DNA_ID=CAMNT_0003281581 /DNA_START=14 /DNA_END=961 /DNA_ORIENTATION=-
MTSTTNTANAQAVGTEEGICPRSKHLVVFDIDGTLLVTKGREIVESPDGLRACVHPLVEECRELLPNGTTSDFRFSGEEEYQGDAFSLFQTAAVIERTATKLRASHSQPCSEAQVAILTARGSSSGWIAEQLSRRLGLQQHIRPDLVKPVYNIDFETAMLDATGHLGSTAQRKAFALGQLIDELGPETVTFLDDMASNLKEAGDYVGTRHSVLRYVPELIPLQDSINACTEIGWDFLHLIEFQCHDVPRSQSMNSLVEALQRCLLAQRLGIHERNADRSITTTTVSTTEITAATHHGFVWAADTLRPPYTPGVTA